MTIYYISPTGSDALAGTSAQPFASLQHAYSKAQAGDTIYLRGGTYSFAGKASGWSLSGRDGTADKPITIASAPGETAVLDGTGMTTSRAAWMGWPTPAKANGALISVWDADHVHIKGIEVKNAPMTGVYANGHHDGLVLERLTVHGSGWLNDEFGTGIAVYGTGNNNKILNNDSYGNRGGGAGATGGNADGFQVFIKGGATGTVIDGNRAWRNGDDGFDFFNVTSAAESARSSPYLVTNNWAFENGFRIDGSMNTSSQSNGNGFKLGGRRPDSSGTHGGHTVKDNLAWGNKMNGFDENGSNGGTLPSTLIGNVSFNNARNANPDNGELGYHYVIRRTDGAVLRDNVAFTSDGGRNEVLVQRPGGGALAGASGNVTNGQASPGFTLEKLAAEIFASLDATGTKGRRDADGSLPDTLFLQDPGVAPVAPVPEKPPVAAPYLPADPAPPPSDDGPAPTPPADTAPAPTPPVDAGPVKTGTAGNDRLVGTAAAERLEGRAGDDVLLAGGGNDTLSGGSGADVLNGGLGRDTASYAEAAAGVTADLADRTANAGDARGDVYYGIENLEGGAFADVLRGNGGMNRLDGGAGGDTLSGGGGMDTLLGGSGDDRLDGGARGDLLAGGAGRDTLTGGADRDTFLFAKGDGGDVVTDFVRGFDRIQLAGDFGFASSADVRLVARGAALGEGPVLVYDKGTGVLSYDPDGAGGAGGVIVATFQNLPGLTAGDFLI